MESALDIESVHGMAPAARVNYGISPGDMHIPGPYLYVGPHDGPPAADEFWNAPFGAVLRYHDHEFPIRPGTDQLPLEELVDRQWYRLAWWRVAGLWGRVSRGRETSE